MLDSDALSRTPSSKSPAKLSIRRALTASRASMPPTTLLHSWQRCQRCAEVGWLPVLQEIDQPVAGGPGDAVIDRGDEDRMHGGLGEIRHPPFLGLADVDLMVERKHDVFEDDVMAAAGAQAEMVPCLDNARARQPRGNQKQADARLGLVGLRPHRIPFQDRRAGRVDLAAAQPPPGFGLPRDRRRQSAARRRAQIGLDPQRIDQRHAFDRFPRQFARKTARPARASRHHQMLDVMHRQHQRGRWIGLAEDAEDARRIERARAVPLPAPSARSSANSPASDSSLKFSNGKLASRSC